MRLERYLATVQTVQGQGGQVSGGGLQPPADRALRGDRPCRNQVHFRRALRPRLPACQGHQRLEGQGRGRGSQEHLQLYCQN